jgi:NADH-quinone oxidoreductase subunit N
MNEHLADFLRVYTTNNDWVAILPEILIALLALAFLLIEMISPRRAHGLIPRVAYWAQGLILIYVLVGPSRIAADGAVQLFSGLISQTDVTQLMRVFFILCSILICHLGRIYLSRHNLPKTEFYTLVLIIASAMMLLVQSSNFVMLFVALETVTIAFYVLVAYCRLSSFSLEAGLKYLIMGALSSSILLFGIVLLYGIAGNPELAGASVDSLSYSELSNFIQLNADNLIVQIGALLVIGGICFKIGAVPFQIWVPDVYQGAPTPVTAYLAIASKAAGFIVLMQLLAGPFADLKDLMLPVLSVIATVTILFGNIAAVSQRNVKRLMGLSGIAHAGYLLVGVIASLSIPWAQYAVIFYLATYLVASFTVFGVMAHLSGSEDQAQQLDDYKDLARTHPFLSGVLACGLGSLAGIPPLGGFIGKLFIFVAAFQAGLHGLLAVSVIGVVISIYYYFGWIRECYFNNGSNDASELPSLQFTGSDRLLLSSLVVATVLLGLVPAVLPIMP